MKEIDAMNSIGGREEAALASNPLNLKPLSPALSLSTTFSASEREREGGRVALRNEYATVGQFPTSAIAGSFLLCPHCKAKACLYLRSGTADNRGRYFYKCPASGVSVSPLISSHVILFQRNQKQNQKQSSFFGF